MIWNRYKKIELTEVDFLDVPLNLERKNTKNMKKKVNPQYICKQIVKSSSIFNERYIKNYK